ncbi:MAG: outer membrane beta-barrel protein [Bacteroidales bacterium]|jgi:hypothetical protein|nr:outer membrane beta-barrel protein [Bacteroidales bacterium]HOI31999.1 outer membrane beta-barrel protein [Bacteroidales bacterium]
MRFTKKVLILLFFVSGNLLVAQEKIPFQRWYLGLSIGSNTLDMNSNSIDLKVNNHTNPVGGAFVQYQLNEQLSLWLGAEFDMREFGLQMNYQGMRYDDTSTYICYSCSYDYDNTYSNYYLTFPLLFQYSKSTNKFAFSFKGGLYYSFLLSSYQSGYEELYIDPVEGHPFYLLDDNIELGLFRVVYTGQTYDIINTYDAGIIFGIGGTYVLTNKIALLLEGNMQVGFQGVFLNPTMISMMHRSFQLRGGLIYRLNLNRTVR